MTMKFTVWSLALFACLASASCKLLRHSSSKVNASVDYRVRLNNFNNVQYSASFAVGDQVLPVIYDTGSFEIIVLSTLCTHCTKDHVMYDSKKSTSFVNSPGVIAEHLFGSGPVVSEKGFETVHLGDSTSPYAVKSFPFWQVVSHEIAVWNKNAHFSGIIGMGHPQLIPEGFGAETSNDQTMLAAMGIHRFSLCLERSKPAAPGWLTVGPSLEQPLYGHYAAIQVVGKVHWGMRMTNLRVPGVLAPNPCQPSCAAIVDSGTSLIAVPPSALGMVTALSNMIMKDCSNLHALPVLKMMLGNKEIELPPKAYVMQVRAKVSRDSSVWKRMIHGPDYEDVMRCSAAFMVVDKKSQVGPVWILGMPFLRYYETIFDRQSKHIYIRPSTEDCAPRSDSATHSFANANATHFANIGAGLDSDSHLFKADDYKPMEVDLNDARMPYWAAEDSKNFAI